MLHAQILYIGDPETGIALQQTVENWHVLMPTETMEALAMHVFYMPNVIVIDGCSEMALETGYHLESLQDGTPMIKVNNASVETLMTQIYSVLGDQIPV